MKALTLHQPWAALVAAGIKLIENRPVRPPAALIGERFAIHAGKVFDHEGAERVKFESGAVMIGAPQSVIVATAVLVGCVVDEGGGDLRALTSVGSFASQLEAEALANLIDQRRWFFGPIGYVLADVRALAEPIACRGMQGFWPVPAAIEEQLR